MNIDEKTYGLIERYLNNALTDIERATFEKKLEEDPTLSLQVKEVKQANALISFMGLVQDKNTIQKAEQQYIRKQKLNYFGKWIAGALLIAGSFFIIIYLNTSDKPSPKNNSIENPLVQEVKKNNIEPKSEKEIIQKKKISIKEETPTQVEYIKTDSSTGNPEIIKTKENVGLTPSATPVVQKVIEPSKTNVIPPVNPCKEKIVATFTTTPTCASKNEGRISINKITGGTAPFEVQLNNKPFTSLSEFSFLSEGQYAILVKDTKGCFSAKQVIRITSKRCPIKKDFIYSYITETPWLFPNLDTDNFIFTIQSLAGDLLLSSSIQNGYPDAWNGLDKNNAKLPIGIYPYKIINAEKEILQLGTITIKD